jgi:hypothetical protein
MAFNPGLKAGDVEKQKIAQFRGVEQTSDIAGHEITLAEDLSFSHIKVFPGDQEKIKFRYRVEDGREEKEKEEDMFEPDSQLSLDLLDRHFFQTPMELQGFTLR